jgi:hypothetical protein
MRQYLDLLDHCLARYNHIAQEWNLSKHWEFLSPQRITECLDRYNFICKIRDAASQTIVRLEQKSLSTGAQRAPTRSLARSQNHDLHIINTHASLAALRSLMSPSHILPLHPSRS